MESVVSTGQRWILGRCSTQHSKFSRSRGKIIDAETGAICALRPSDFRFWGHVGFTDNNIAGFTDRKSPIVSPIVFHHFSVFSQWYKLESDEGKTFEQRIALTYGEEKPLLENIATFQMTQQWHRISANFQAFPPLKPVEYALTLSVREQGNSQWPSPIASYPINVKQAPQVPTAVN